MIFRLKFILFSLLLVCSCKEKSVQTSKAPVSKTVKESNDSLQGLQSLNKHFMKYGVQGSITIYDHKRGKMITNDEADSRRQTFPASTFKIINLLIALETGVIKNEHEIIRWPGKMPDTTVYGHRPEIYHDMPVRQAFRISAGWVFSGLAQKIGRDNYEHYLAACNYGNRQHASAGPDFWNFGPLAISPLNQVEFLRTVYEGRVPFSKRNLEVLNDLMVSEKTGEYIIRSKTGWSRQNNRELGWWTGYLEKENAVYIFATRITQPFRGSYDPKFGGYRKEITLNAFRDLNIIE